MRLLLPEPFLPSNIESGLNKSIDAVAKFLKFSNECMATYPIG